MDDELSDAYQLAIIHTEALDYYLLETSLLQEILS
jgi:hypothetical protein